MNPIRKKQDTGITWYFEPIDIDGQAVPRGTLWSPSGQGFRVDSIAADGKVTARSGSFKLVGRDDPAKWKRVFVNEEQAASEIVSNALSDIGEIQRAIYRADWTRQTEKSRLFADLESAKAPRLFEARALDSRYRSISGQQGTIDPPAPLSSVKQADDEAKQPEKKTDKGLVDSTNYDPSPGESGIGIWLIIGLGLALALGYRRSESS